MSDRFGNNVDGEIWAPYKVRDWHDIGVGGSATGEKEYTIAYANGRTRESVYAEKCDAVNRLERIRDDLREFAIPEEYWPILMERDVTTNYSSWRHLDV